jgi:hypothetical protein
MLYGKVVNAGYGISKRKLQNGVRMPGRGNFVGETSMFLVDAS